MERHNKTKSGIMVKEIEDTNMEKIRVYCKNTEKFYEIEPGTTLVSLMEEI